MYFDALLESRALPTYRSVITRAIEQGHQIDLLYQAAKSLFKPDDLGALPLLMVSLHFDKSIEMGHREVAGNAAAAGLPHDEYRPITDGWRLWSDSSAHCEIADVKANEFSLLSRIRMTLNRFLAPRLVVPIVRIFRFSEKVRRPNFSLFLFAQGLAGLESNDAHRHVLMDDNVLIFEEESSISALPALATQFLRSLGQITPSEEIKAIIERA